MVADVVEVAPPEQRHCKSCFGNKSGKFYAVRTQGRFRYWRCEACQQKRSTLRKDIGK